MVTPMADPAGNVESLNSLIGWFNHNSVELIDEYRRLEARLDYLKNQLEVKNRELEKSLQAREQARAYLLSVLESLKGGVAVLDHELHPTFVNRRLTELAGKVNDQRIRQWLGDKLVASLQGGDNCFLPFECEKVVQGPDGAMVPVHFSVAEVATGDPASHYVLVFQDVTIVEAHGGGGGAHAPVGFPRHDGIRVGASSEKSPWRHRAVRLALEGKINRRLATARR